MFSAQQYILATLDEAKKRSRMVGVLGREGMGKSSGIAYFIQNQQSVYYLRIGTTYTISNLLNELLFQLSGAYPTTGALFDKMKELSYLLTKDNAKKLIVLDDAGRLSPRALSTWFELRDNTIQTTGFVFIGLDYFQKNLLRAKKNGVPGIAEFYRRVENWYSVPGLKRNEIVDYGTRRNLNSDQLQQLCEANVETIAELENYTSALREESELAEQEDRQPKPVSLPGQNPKTKNRKTSAIYSKQGINEMKDEDEDEEDEDNEVNESSRAAKNLQAKQQAAKKAREAKHAKLIPID